MEMKNIPFGTNGLDRGHPDEHEGETGIAVWRTQQFDNIRVRMVEYGPVITRTIGAKKVISCYVEGELQPSLPMEGNLS